MCNYLDEQTKAEIKTNFNQNNLNITSMTSNCAKEIPFQIILTSALTKFKTL